MTKKYSNRKKQTIKKKKKQTYNHLNCSILNVHFLLLKTKPILFSFHIFHSFSFFLSLSFFSFFFFTFLCLSISPFFRFLQRQSIFSCVSLFSFVFLFFSISFSFPFRFYSAHTKFFFFMF